MVTAAPPLVRRPSMVKPSTLVAAVTAAPLMTSAASPSSASRMNSFVASKPVARPVFASNPVDPNVAVRDHKAHS